MECRFMLFREMVVAKYIRFHKVVRVEDCVEDGNLMNQYTI